MSIQTKVNDIKKKDLRYVASLATFMVNNNPNFSGLLSAFPFSEKTDTQSVCVFLFNIILL